MSDTVCICYLLGDHVRPLRLKGAKFIYLVQVLTSYSFEGKGGFEQGGLFDLAKQGAVKLFKTTRR